MTSFESQSTHLSIIKPTTIFFSKNPLASSQQLKFKRFTISGSGTLRLNIP
ncbi:MAG TPA: hypothetical protein VE076_07075 [Nitrososphaeraceae archaeon]|nr:hypothetical protein [Nitrososphaeraceae archaeon]